MEYIPTQYKIHLGLLINYMCNRILYSCSYFIPMSIKKQLSVRGTYTPENRDNYICTYTVHTFVILCALTTVIYYIGSLLAIYKIKIKYQINIMRFVLHLLSFYTHLQCIFNIQILKLIYICVGLIVSKYIGTRVNFTSHIILRVQKHSDIRKKIYFIHVKFNIK